MKLDGVQKIRIINELSPIFGTMLLKLSDDRLAFLYLCYLKNKKVG